MQLYHLEPGRPLTAAERTAGKGEVHHIRTDGTGFFVYRDTELFLLTARHVAEKTYDLHAEVRVSQRLPADPHLFRVLALRLELPRSRWCFHPVTGDSKSHPVDVAAMKIPLLSDVTVTGFTYCPMACPDASSLMLASYNQLAEDPVPPDRVVVFGFPANLTMNLMWPVPIGHQGMVALKTDEELIRVASRYLDAKTFLLDTRISPGYSGSPIITTPGKIYLVGLVVKEDKDLDFALAEPVSRIKEVLEVAKDTTTDFQPWHLLFKFRGEDRGLNWFDIREFCTIAEKRFRERKVPVGEMEKAGLVALRGPLYSTGSEAPSRELLEAVTKVARRYDVTSVVSLKTKAPGARVFFQTLGQRERSEQATAASQLTNCIQRIPIGYYYIWSERRNRATSNRNQFFRVVDRLEVVELEE